MKHYPLLGLAPLALYLGRSQWCRWSLLSSSVFARLKAIGDLWLSTLSRRITSSAKPW